MRKSNKIIALVLSIILTVSMSATVFAATKAKPNEWDSFGTSAEGVSYAIIISNLLVPLIDKLTLKGGVVKWKK